ncbi:MDR family MFS transporter [Phytoactinopolyspora halotolerans]|uniref:MFS transporter n=1 Tax=Phytoactinopolyspora halotolerans TaxID=1981512 RepID=A0A6L9SFU1_9ACTN|nr:MDR family MFS transporter [Phytoactinopolyspora halotolerans]NEE03969.1 MFS transporter [Phytoactinopolyspora halotolerans]
MTHRQVVQAMSGLLLATFVSALSGTIVANAMPRILADLEGRQSQYTWIVAAHMLAATASGPIWGKLADRMSKRLLVEMSLSTFVVGTVLCGVSTSPEALIAFRAVQGVGSGGLLVLVQVARATLVSPRERARYVSYFSAVATVAMLAGPPLGGLVVDTPAMGWRWCFWIGTPFAIFALVVLHRTLHLPVTRTSTNVDWRGALLIPVGIGTILLWVTMAGNVFDWNSWMSAALAGGGLGLLAGAIMAERRAQDPIVPSTILRVRTVRLAITAAVGVSVVMICAMLFLAQYFQIARGYSPSQSGLLLLPLIVGSLIGTTVSGQLISRSGRWKRYLATSMVLTVAGTAALGAIGNISHWMLVGSALVVLGLGLGTGQQNLMLAVQNSAPDGDLGSATSTLMFFRSLGEAAGVSLLGALFAARVTSEIDQGLARQPGTEPLSGLQSSTIPELSSLAEPVRDVVQSAYADAVGMVFLAASALAVLALAAVAFIRETPLDNSSPSLLDRRSAD